MGVFLLCVCVRVCVCYVRVCGRAYGASVACGCACVGVCGRVVVRRMRCAARGVCVRRELVRVSAATLHYAQEKGASPLFPHSCES